MVALPEQRGLIVPANDKDYHDDSLSGEEAIPSTSNS